MGSSDRETGFPDREMGSEAYTPPEDAPHHFGGIHNRSLGGEYAHHLHDAREGGFSTPQWSSNQRSDDRYDAYFTSCRTLTITAVIRDPVYLTEPHILSRSWQLDPSAPNITNLAAPCVPAAETPDLKEGAVPHFLPEKNPFVGEVTRLYNIPVEAVLGGAETMYPEYRKKLKDSYVAPARCTRYCCGWGGAPGNPAPGLTCITDGGGPR